MSVSMSYCYTCGAFLPDVDMDLHRNVCIPKEGDGGDPILVEEQKAILADISADRTSPSSSSSSSSKNDQDAVKEPVAKTDEKEVKNDDVQKNDKEPDYGRMFPQCPFVMPDEISTLILNMLDDLELMRCSTVSREWYRLHRDDYMWRNLCERSFSTTDWSLLEEENVRFRGILAEGGWKGIYAHFSGLRYFVRKPVFRDTYKTRESQERALFRNHNQIRVRPGVNCIHFNKDVLFAGLTDGRVLSLGIRKMSSRELENPRNGFANAHEQGVYAIQISSSGDTVFTAGFDRLVKVWKYFIGDNGRYELKLVRIIEGHSDVVSSLQGFEDMLLTGCWDSKVRLFSVRTGRQICTFHGATDGILCVAFNRQYVVGGGYDGHLRVWDINSGDLIHSALIRKNFNNEPVPLSAVAIDHERIAVGTWDSRILEFYVNDMEIISHVSVPNRDAEDRHDRHVEHGRVHSLVLENGMLLAMFGFRILISGLKPVPHTENGRNNEKGKQKQRKRKINNVVVVGRFIGDDQERDIKLSIPIRYGDPENKCYTTCAYYRDRKIVTGNSYGSFNFYWNDINGSGTDTRIDP